MAVTLVEAAKQIRGDDFRASIIEIYGRSTQLMERLPFQSISGNALSFVMEDTPADVDFRAVNEGYTESSGTFSRVTEPLVICGGDIDVDRFIVKTSGPSIRATQEAGKVKRLGQLFTYKFIKGDQSSSAKEFTGLQARITSTSSQYVENHNSGAALSLAKLDEAIDKVRDPTNIVMNQAMARRFSQALRPDGSNNPAVAGGLLDTHIDEFGRRVTRYNNLPFIVLDDNTSLYTALPFTEGGGSATSIYVVSLRADGLCGIQNGDPMVDDLGELQTAPKFRTRIEWYAGISAMHPFCAARVFGITNAALTA